MRIWVVIACLVALAIELTLFGERLPAPRPPSAAATEFSADRAMPILRSLTDLGIRLSGTPNARIAADRLVTELRKLPRVEVEVQEAAHARQYTDTAFPYPMFVYRTINVIARLPGRTRDAVLLNAHFDTTGTSFGAGDDAFGVAAIVETMRAMSAEAPRERSIIALLNGGEEYGMRGADGFTHHPFSRDVRAYVYIDGMAIGKARLGTTTPGHPELLETYARVAPRPSANILMQDYLDNSSTGYDGDHRPLQDAGLAGLMLAAIDDMASSHTSRDRPERVSVPSLQHMGDTTLALTRALADAPPAGKVDVQRPVYFDVLGQLVIAYSRTTASVLGLLGLVVAGTALYAAAARRRVTVRRLLSGLAWTSLAQLAGLLGALLAAVLLVFVLRRPYGWYTTPWLAGVAFPAAALSAVLGVHALFRRRLQDEDAAPWVAWAACIAGWALWLLLATIRQVGVGYLALIWTTSLSVGLLAALRWPRWMSALALASLVPGLLATANLALPTLVAMIPFTCTVPLPIPPDPIVAVLVTLPALMVVAGVAVTAHLAGRLGRAALRSLSLAAVGLLVLSLRPPFNAENPRRVLATHIETDGHSAIALRAFDVLPLDPDLSRVPGVTAPRVGWHPNPSWWPEPTHEVPAAPPPFELPSALVSGRAPQADGTRTVALRLVSSTPYLAVLIPRSRLAGWSLSPALPSEPADGDRDMIHFSGMRAEGEPLELRIRGTEPVEIELRAFVPAPGEALEGLLRQLPDHIVLWPEMARVVRTSI